MNSEMDTGLHIGTDRDHYQDCGLRFFVEVWYGMGHHKEISK